MPTCFRCNAESTLAHYERIVDNKTSLHGPWAGWRMAGRDLVSPDGDRINPRRLAGILWGERCRNRLNRPNPTGRPINPQIIIPAMERFAGSA